MSGAASIDPAVDRLSPVVRAAARGELPDWARVTPRRREHIERVAALLTQWAQTLELTDAERIRWTAAGFLHDALRDAGEEELRSILQGDSADLHPALLHGPAAAHRLAADADESTLTAIRYHTVGHPDLDRLGRALYLADFLEPGRTFAGEWRAELRERMPTELDAVLVEVLASRIEHLLTARKPVRPETSAFWNAVVGSA